MSRDVDLHCVKYCLYIQTRALALMPLLLNMALCNKKKAILTYFTPARDHRFLVSEYLMNIRRTNWLHVIVHLDLAFSPYQCYVIIMCSGSKMWIGMNGCWMKNLAVWLITPLESMSSHNQINGTITESRDLNIQSRIALRYCWFRTLHLNCFR